ncbi:MAG: TRAP transporter permease [Alphaproteobacteria bacterium]|nr:TRAP transporter permease [Alphaproteobacteria bacterium]
MTNAAQPQVDEEISKEALREAEAAAGHIPTLGGFAGKVVFWMGVIFSLFQIYTAAYNPISSIIVRSVHVGFVLFLVFMLFRVKRDPHAENPGVPLYDWFLAIAAFALGFYHWVFHIELMTYPDPTPMDMVVGSIIIVMVFEAARRVMGMALPVICGLFLAYLFFGDILPFPFGHRGYDFDLILHQLYRGVEGIYGIPIQVSATFIFLFILFGTFLEKAGMIQLFNDIAMGSVGHYTGGPAKVAVVSSALMGTINGSGVANVVSTGQFTIPLMKRFGYRPAFAGAVEATASMGGQIMPPVMGAVAFIMAENLDRPYAEIALAATIPAILYFASAFWMVHLEAKRMNLSGLPKDQCPSPWLAIKKSWYLLLPLVILVYLLFAGFTPLYAGTVGLGFTVVLILGGRIAAKLGAMPFRFFLWIVLGILGGLYLKTENLNLLVGIVVALLVVTALFKGAVETYHLMLDSLAEGARNSIAVAIACALVGVIIGTLTMTGLGGTFARVVVGVAGDSKILALILTMVVCLILGMGIPTIPNYIITASMVAPALLGMGVELLQSHMFVFYFGIMADLTPPVALAAFAASSIAKESAMKIGMIAVRVALAGFVIPFMFVYDPALLLQTDDPLAVVYITFKALLAIGLWGGAASGYLIGPMGWIDRAIATIAAALLIAAVPITDELGFALSAVFIAWHWWRTRQAPARA